MGVAKAFISVVGVLAMIGVFLAVDHLAQRVLRRRTGDDATARPPH